MKMADARTSAPSSRPSDGSSLVMTRPLRDKIVDLAKATPEAYRAVAVTLRAPLAAAGAVGFDEYRVPGTHEFVIYEIHPHIVVPDLGDAGVPAPAGYRLTVRDLVAALAMNATIALRNSDRAQPIFENRDLTLAALVEAAGGQPFRLPDPHKIPVGELLRLDVRLGGSAVAAAPAEYGVVLVGDLIRVAKS
jgi:hypothetical protein